MCAEWTLDEIEHAGEEHLDPGEAARFDEKLPFDPSPEVDILLDLGLSQDDIIVDLGTGTGAFPLAIAGHCDRVVAVDVSPAMLGLVEEKLGAHEISNIETVHAGFLSYQHRDEPADFVFSKDALHHLPDFWKCEALNIVYEILAPGGMFRLRDFVYSFDPTESIEHIEPWIAENRQSTRFSDEEIYRHFRDEYSTYGFLLESMLESVGFEILDVEYESEFYAAYTCTRPAPTA